jgi:hypothetical protein
MQDDDLISLSQTVNNVAPSGLYMSAVAEEAEAHAPHVANGSPLFQLRRSKTFQVSCTPGRGDHVRHFCQSQPAIAQPKSLASCLPTCATVLES